MTLGDPADLGNYAEFKLSITQALGDQLAEHLADLTRAPLTQENLDKLPSLKGVYQLYRHDELVYIGKADQSLPQRLTRHLNKLRGRENTDIEHITFTALSVDEDFNAVTPEELLIKKHQGAGDAPWNENGFGINDPGQNRDTTFFAPDHFDHLYPARLDWVIDGLPVGNVDLKTLLHIGKTNLPYTFRYAHYRDKNKVKFYADFEVTLETSAMTADEFFHLVSAQLPSPWQIMVLPGYVVMYPKDLRSESARKYYIEGESFAPDDLP
ncbi:GIY-YIG nuclease family protein [Streptomyces boncukensis]|uniref:GIY-YIG nuclease family protein n=1 Tax=Streptomyces boncukensis TaxID=2711219 RepID=A0A6G4WZC5_9ACTN|nr:GIY-YIG nuclease family protein [Streptomyces boncukensis]NGO70636.1 GIY-YIG nuclease family protein [Streptomyces boncukensis]